MSSFDYLALLDYEHLDQHFFMKSLVKELAKEPHKRGILLHGDSPLTDRIMQEGVMRQEAQIRATKELNHRLVGLLADEGIPALGLHAYQKGLITPELTVSKASWDSLPSIPVIVLSTLIGQHEKAQEMRSLTEIQLAVASQLPISEVIGFSLLDYLEWNLHSVPSSLIEQGTLELESEFVREHLPTEIQSSIGYRITVPGTTGSASFWKGSLNVVNLQ